MRVTLWAFFLIVDYCHGWWNFGDDGHFFNSAQKELEAFHKMLHPLEDLGSSASHNAKSAAGGHSETGHSAASGGGKSKKDDVKVHHNESSKKGSTGKETKKANYAHVIGMKSAHQDGSSHQGSHHEEQEGGHGGHFKDKLSHKKGNYAKGYRGKYHLDEFKHHDKYWSNKDIHDKYTRYGKHGIHHHSDHKVDHKSGTQKEGGGEDHHGKKGETAKGSHSEDHKGHKSEKGNEQTYSHKSQQAKQHNKS